MVGYYGSGRKFSGQTWLTIAWFSVCAKLVARGACTGEGTSGVNAGLSAASVWQAALIYIWNRNTDIYDFSMDGSWHLLRPDVPCMQLSNSAPGISAELSQEGMEKGRLTLTGPSITWQLVPGVALAGGPSPIIDAFVFASSIVHFARVDIWDWNLSKHIKGASRHWWNDRRDLISPPWWIWGQSSETINRITLTSPSVPIERVSRSTAAAVVSIEAANADVLTSPIAILTSIHSWNKRSWLN